MHRVILCNQSHSILQSKFQRTFHDVVVVQRKRFATDMKSAPSAPPSAKMSTASMPHSASAAASAATLKAKPTSASTGSFSLLKMYEGYLDRMPVLTKMVTGAFLWGLGDGVAQTIPKVTADSSDANYRQVVEAQYDWMRTARAVLFGFAIHAPTSHVHFNFLEWMTVRANVTGLKIPVFKAFMEQFVYWSWISNSMYHGAMGAMQGMGPADIQNRISDVLWETQKAQWAFWIPVQLLNFRFVPVRHQLNVVLVTSVAWTALLSAWYPPEDVSGEVGAVAPTPALGTNGDEDTAQQKL